MRALLVVLLLAGSAHADRVAHLEEALAQLRPDPYALDRAIYDAVRTRCKPAAPGGAIATACMIEVARELCRGKCLAAADVIVTNQHAERDLLDEATRMRLVRSSTDYHAAVLAELRTRYAILATELVLAPRASLAAQIDRLCVTRDQIARRCEPNAPACLGTIAYQRCAAGLVWFASTQPREVKR